jgi:hypothetical protein
VKVKKLLEAIDASAAIFAVARDAEMAAELRGLADALKPRAGLELAFVSEVLAVENKGPPDRLSDALRGIANLHRLSGAKKFAQDFQALADQSFAGSIVGRISSLDLVAYFSSKLREADADPLATQRLLKVMGSAGILGPKDAAAIAVRYIGAPTTYRNKKAALEAIRDRAARDAGLESKSRQSV